MTFIEKYTSDGLKLPMVHYDSGERDLCVIYTHGMAENIVEDGFARIWAEKLSSGGIGFLYGHTRGFSQINYLTNTDGERKRYGTAYEIFDECLLDVDLFVDTVLELGYKKLVLLGHSLGCNKVIYYISEESTDRPEIAGVILASPPDLVGLEKMPEYQENYSELAAEATENMKNGNPRKILRSEIWGEYELSSQTYLSLYSDDGKSDNLPVLKNPEHFSELEKIKVPTLAFMGENDDIKIRTIVDDLALIKSKAINCPDFATAIIAGANHYYYGKEQETADLIQNWLCKRVRFE
jgi:alpha-beta hydrolase superfamily lysophospholipase